MESTRSVLILCGLVLVCSLLIMPHAAHSQTPSVLGEVATQVAAGDSHTCALTTDGAVQCWGNNYYGQLGNGSTTDSSTPVAVSGLGSGVAAIALGKFHSCALTTTGVVQCWGWNSRGQLGDGFTTDSSTPVTVSTLASGVAAIAAGDVHTCALTTAGEVQCWGLNSHGQLGDGSTTNSSTPVAVNTLGSGVAAITAGDVYTCALTTASGVECWGQNNVGQLGDGSTTNSSTPVAVSTLGSGVAAIAADHGHTCALTTAGGVQCWGNNNVGQLGDGSTEESHTPVTVSGLPSGVAAIAAGVYYTCALTTAGEVQCWGYNNRGQLGNGSWTSSSTPIAVSGLASGVAAIAAGGSHTCALTTTGGVQCWGYNDHGQLGNGSTTGSSTPIAASGFASGVVAVTVGDFHTCALTTAGGVQCWGWNGYGQFGDGSTMDSPTPVAVSGLSGGVAAIAAGYGHTCALTTTGGAQCWGWNGYGQLGDGATTDSPTPVAVSGLSSGVAAIAAGDGHTCALTTTGGVQCWGYNHHGQLGDGSTMDSPTPVAVSGLSSGVVAIAVGESYTCALTTVGGVQCWGYNNYGQLGSGSTASSSTPVAVSTLASGVAAITTGAYHTCALTSTGGVQCWGYNQFGQLGDGSGTSSSIPVAVSGLASGVEAIAAGVYYTCGLTTAGGVQCWGDNGYGQLGDGSTTNSPTPIAVSGLASGVAAIAGGYGHTCALTTAGAVQCWGSNAYGQFGDGSTMQQLTPVVIRAGQSILFHPPMSLGNDTTLDLTATATSSRVVTFDTWTPDTCSISGNTLTILSAPEALCGVRASQQGGPRAAGGSDAPAPQQLRLIRISDFIFANDFDK